MPNIFAKLTEITPMVWLILACVVLVSLVGYFLTRHKANQTRTIYTTKKIVYAGLCISISFILSYIRLYKMPQGGSITLASMFPLVLYAMVFGPTAGIVAGMAYGLLQCIQDPWIVHWAQFLLDYPLAYGALGLAGFAPLMTKNLKLSATVGIFIALFGRGLMHFLSGIIFFASSAPEGTSPALYSLIYNLSYIGPEFIITLALSLALMTTPIYSMLKKNATAHF